MTSLELNWIRKYDKSIPMPEICFLDTDEFGGQYWSPEYGPQEFNNKRYENKNGIILVSEGFPDTHGSVIAHEWRHHWQFHKGIIFDNYWPDGSLPYDQYLAQYYGKSSTELDAVRFEHKYAKNWWTTYKLDLVDKFYPHKNLTKILL